jgi:hypothetical protein
MSVKRNTKEEELQQLPSDEEIFEGRLSIRCGWIGTFSFILMIREWVLVYF